MWRVGDGRKIRVWGEKSLPAEHIPKLVSSKPENAEVEVVADLRNPVREGWNKRLIISLQKILN